jgi:hypothetical protein
LDWVVVFAIVANAPTWLLKDFGGGIAQPLTMHIMVTISGLTVGAALYWLYIVQWEPGRENTQPSDP